MHVPHTVPHTNNTHYHTSPMTTWVYERPPLRPRPCPPTPPLCYRDGWHWNMPYSINRDLPEWYKKEVERYSY